MTTTGLPGSARAERWIASPDQVSTPLEGEVVVLHVQEGRYFRLDGVGAVAWERLQTPASLDDLVAAVAARYRVDDARARADLATLLADLRRAGLVVPARGSGGSDDAASGAGA